MDGFHCIKYSIHQIDLTQWGQNWNFLNLGEEFDVFSKVFLQASLVLLNFLYFHKKIRSETLTDMTRKYLFFKKKKH